MHPKVLWAPVVALALSGCPSDAPSNAPPAGSPATFTSLSRTVLVSCSTSGCHGGTSPAGNLNLEADKAYAALVGVAPDNAQARSDGLLRVSAGDPAKSFLLTKLEPLTKSGYGARMPMGGRLSEADVLAVRQWIVQGARND